MTIPSHSNVPAADLLVNSDQDEDIWDLLVDNTRAARYVVLTTHIDEQSVDVSHVTDVFSSIFKFKVWLNDLGSITGGTKELHILLPTKIAITENGEVRLKDLTSGSVSNVQTVTTSTYSNKVLVCPLTGTLDQSHEFDIQGWTPTSNMLIEALTRIDWWMEL